MELKNNEIHYTDYSFQKLCERKYGINRGVYNTIDNWFYEKGVQNIQERRADILTFLKHIVCRLDSNHRSKLRFGSGGLISKLNEFWNLSDRISG